MTSKIQILSLMKEIFKFVGVLPVQDQSENVRLLKIGIFLFPLVATVLEVIASMIVNISDIAKMTEALYLCIGYFMAIVVYFSLLDDRVNIQCLVEGLERIVNERYQLEGFNFYASEDAKINFSMKCVMIYATVLIVPMAFHSVLNVIYDLTVGQYNLDSWKFLYHGVYPFETNTDVRRGILTTFQSVAGCTVVVFLLIPQMFFFAISYYLAKIIDDLKMIIAKIDRVCDETETVTEYLVELVLLHQRVLSLRNDFANIMNFPIFITNGLNFLGLCSLLYQIQHAAESFNLSLVYKFLSSYLFLQQQLYLFCFFGEKITSKSPEVGSALYQSQWYHYSVKHRRIIQMVIMRSQKLFILTGNGLVPCTLQNFKEMLNTTVSAFLLIRKFAE